MASGPVVLPVTISLSHRRPSAMDRTKVARVSDRIGLVSSRVVRQSLELVIVNYGDEHRRLAESLAPESIEAVELNLEDAFIEYTRGPRRALPIFAGETADAQGDGLQGTA